MSVAVGSSGRGRKFAKWTLVPLAIISAWLAFRLFEPIFTWSTGWQALPPSPTHAVADGARHADPDWLPVTRQADESLRGARQRLQAPALSAAIMVDGKRVWAAAFGMADVARAQPANLESSFRLGSTSKAVNALAMGRLIDSGKLDIERSVRQYIPDLPPTYDAVTTRLAISHTAGVPDYGLCLCFPVWEHRNRRHFAGVRESLRTFENRPLIAGPGEGFQYSSYGANVAGAVVEAAAGQPYLDFVNDAVFKPLYMTHSAGDVIDAAIPNRVQFYEVTEGKYKPADPVDNSIRYPSGGMLSTPSDMLALGNAFLGSGLLTDATRQRLLTRQKLRDGSDNPQGYALGIRVFDDKKLFNDSVSTPMYSHHGIAVGSTSYFAVYPEHGLVISMMMNKGQESIDAMAPEADHLVELFIAERNRRKQQALARR